MPVATTSILLLVALSGAAPACPENERTGAVMGLVGTATTPNALAAGMAAAQTAVDTAKMAVAALIRARPRVSAPS